MRTILSSVLVLILLFCTVQEVVGQDQLLAVKAPSSGSLSSDELAAIASDIRRVEANPLAPDAANARRDLFQWVSGSPDVHVTICGEIPKGFMDSKGKYKSELFLQFILSSAAQGAENPALVDDQLALSISGVRGALVSYRIMKEREGRSVRDRFLDRLEKLEEKGELEGWVSKALKGC